MNKRLIVENFKAALGFVPSQLQGDSLFDCKFHDWGVFKYDFVDGAVVVAVHKYNESIMLDEDERTFIKFECLSDFNFWYKSILQDDAKDSVVALRRAIDDISESKY